MRSYFSPKGLVLTLLLLVTVAAAGALIWWELGAPVDLETYGRVPDFVLTDQDGRPLSNHDLLGQIWVANFVFTRCRGTCPMLTRRMQDIAKWAEDYGDDRVKIISFSVDPERDTPSDLKKYAEMFGIDTQNWKFVTGPEPALREVVVKGFKTGMERVGALEGSGDSLFEILHGQRFVLVDSTGEVRGFYSADRAGLNQLKAALTQLKKNHNGIALTSP